MSLKSVKDKIKKENMRLVRNRLFESFPLGINKVYSLHIHAKYGLQSSVSVLIEPVFEEAVTGEKYVTIMKYGIISGIWDADTKTCTGYYWHDMEWYPHKLYAIEEETSEVS